MTANDGGNAGKYREKILYLLLMSLRNQRWVSAFYIDALTQIYESLDNSHFSTCIHLRRLIEGAYTFISIDYKSLLNPISLTQKADELSAMELIPDSAL